jgi:peroxiredoxin
MNLRLLTPLIAAALLLSALTGPAAATNDVTTELGGILMKVNNKVKAGQATEPGLADELKELDALLARHQDEKTDAVAEILFQKARVYFLLFNNPAKAAELIRQIKKDFPETQFGRSAEANLQLLRQEEGRRTNAALVVGVRFPDFNEQDLAGKPLSVAQFNGKVVLIDFWATWCPPCVRELPGMLDTYKKHHDQGFEIIGISLDQDKLKLESFIKAKDLSWPQFFDGKGWENKLAVQYGITQTPSNFLLDREGRILGRDLHGADLEQAVAKALALK